ncbi:DNA primase large subunit [Natronoarchaeum philippinense]|uniref:DNA primase large subunit PriL n=1 Tax=Natronoarchaeum philippinense TaxID=558529 RepID=A0A285P2G0_NATPI|nr:DNA primase large subunit PriL [Natronoarchaeum philippinense]SNZ15638.1 DNA primase large subunit [Natronoarchaeum philippinense]
MKRLHARYPFLDAAREAVELAEVDLAELVLRDDGAAAVDRAVERVDAALSGESVGAPHRRPRVELLSYPIARVLVSLVDEPVLLRKYAHAEASTARERFEADADDDAELKSTSGSRMTIDRLLADFDLAGDVRSTGDDQYRVAVGPYLRLSGQLDGAEWRLATRALGDGEVPVEEAELRDLLEAAIRERVADGLPLPVPDPIAEGLSDAVERIEESLADRQLSTDFDAVVPSLFPPCIRALLEQVDDGESIDEPGRFALTSFLTSLGMAPDAAADLVAGATVGGESIRYQAAHLGDEDDPGYAPPSCNSMVAYGLCVDKDELCESVEHPITYYDRRLDDADTATAESE